jgi:pyruvate/2-oxoglutarate dehydrogenase complex dihydrolipoamide acyltransferase (E2) component
VPSPTFGVLSKKCVLPGEAIEAGEPLAVLMGVNAPLVDAVPESVGINRAIAPRSEETKVAYALAIVDVAEALRLIGRVARGETVSGQPEKLSLLPFVLSAVATSLVRFPALKVRRADGSEVAPNIGVEVRDWVGELWLPVLANAHRASVLGLSREWARLHERVRTGSLVESDISGASFIVSEAPRILYRTPTLHAPFVGHLCFGKTIGEQIYLCLGYDAALINGGTAEAFLADIAEGLASAGFLFA